MLLGSVIISLHEWLLCSSWDFSLSLVFVVSIVWDHGLLKVHNENSYSSNKWISALQVI